MSTSTTQVTRAGTTTWVIDPSHTLVEFSARHMMVATVKGRFTGVRGTIVDHNDDPSRSSVEVEVDPKTLTTGDPQRDAHLKSADFLDVEKYPTITFRSTRIEGSRDHFKVTGDLTLHGVTHEITLDTEFNGRGISPYGKEVAGFSTSTKLNRKDWGLNWNVALETGGVLVGETVKVAVEVEAVRQD